MITLFLSVEVIEEKFEALRKFFRLRLLFVILFIASNLLVLPIYYRSEKQDFRGLVKYLVNHVQDGDKIVVFPKIYMRGILYYFGIRLNEDRDYLFEYRKVSQNEIEYYMPLSYQNKRFILSNSKSYWNRYILEGDRVWLITDKELATKVAKAYPVSQIGYFDGSVHNLEKFPTDVSMYLLLLDPKIPKQDGREVFIK